jgi:hypothetical protein
MSHGDDGKGAYKMKMSDTTRANVNVVINVT